MAGSRIASFALIIILTLAAQAARAGQTLYTVVDSGYPSPFQIDRVSSNGQLTNVITGSAPSGSVGQFAVDQSGNFYVPITGDASPNPPYTMGVEKYSATGQSLGFIEPLPATTSSVSYTQANAVALDASGNIWTSYVVSGPGSGGLHDVFECLSPTGQILSSFTSFFYGVSGVNIGDIFVDSLAIGPNGNLYAGTDGQVLEFSPTGTLLAALGPDSRGYYYSSLAFDPSGDLYAVDSANGIVAEYSPTNQFLGNFPSVQGYTNSIAIDNLGNIYLGTSGSIEGFNSSGQSDGFQAVSSGNAGLAFGPSVVPEPTSLALCGIAGAIGLVASAIRRVRA